MAISRTWPTDGLSGIRRPDEAASDGREIRPDLQRARSLWQWQTVCRGRPRAHESGAQLSPGGVADQVLARPQDIPREITREQGHPIAPRDRAFGPEYRHHGRGVAGQGGIPVRQRRGISKLRSGLHPQRRTGGKGTLIDQGALGGCGIREREGARGDGQHHEQDGPSLGVHPASDLPGRPGQPQSAAAAGDDGCGARHQRDHPQREHHEPADHQGGGQHGQGVDRETAGVTVTTQLEHSKSPQREQNHVRCHRDRAGAEHAVTAQMPRAEGGDDHQDHGKRRAGQERSIAEHHLHHRGRAPADGRQLSGPHESVRTYGGDRHGIRY